MEYGEALKTIKRKRICPFCQTKENEIIEESTYMYVIPARAPYIKDHLLIIPKRHVNLLKELSQRELTDLYTLVDTRTKKLHQYHKSVNLLLRDGLVSDRKCGKSINHLHFHLVPDCDIGEKTGKGEPNREFLNEKKYQQTNQEIKEKFN
jgi:diadenosine tetraphosphate (Ap4A) HIT family hydrolase